jgi:hypothetical protein
MSKYLSDQNQLAFIYESGTYANTSGTRQWIGLVQDCTIDEEVNVIPIRYQGSTDRNVDMFEDGNLDYTGTFSYFPQDWKFLGFAIGSISETASAGSHVFTETNSDDVIYNIPNQSLTSFTLEDSKNNGTAGSNFIRTLNGCMVNTFTTTFSQGDIVKCDVDIMGQNLVFTSGAVTKVTPSTTRPFMCSKSILQIPSGTTINNSTEFSLVVNNNLEAGHYNNGSIVIAESLPINRDYELNATIKMDSTNAKTFYENYYLGGSTFNAQIQSIGAGGSAFIVFSGCKLTDMETPSPMEGTHDQSLTIVPQHVSATVEDAIVNYNAW